MASNIIREIVTSSTNILSTGYTSSTHSISYFEMQKITPSNYVDKSRTIKTTPTVVQEIESSMSREERWILAGGDCLLSEFEQLNEVVSIVKKKTVSLKYGMTEYILPVVAIGFACIISLNIAIGLGMFFIGRHIIIQTEKF